MGETANNHSMQDNPSGADVDSRVTDDAGKSSGIETEIFRMSGGSMALWLLSLYGKPWISVMSILVVIMALAAVIVDLRWGIVCLMLIFILLPMSLAFLYYFHALRPLTAMNVIPHRLRIMEATVSIELFEKEKDKDTGDEKFVSLYTKVIPSAMFRRYKIGTDSVVFPQEPPEEGFLWIPSAAFADKDCFRKAVEMMAANDEALPDS